jgi:small subunit ribosomal protein S4
MVVHGHVSIGDRFVNLPGHIVRKEEENRLLVHLELSKPSSSPTSSSTSVPNG